MRKSEPPRSHRRAWRESFQNLFFLSEQDYVYLKTSEEEEATYLRIFKTDSSRVGRGSGKKGEGLMDEQVLIFTCKSQSLVPQSDAEL